MIKLLHTSSTSIFLLTLLPPQRPFYLLEHAKDLPTSGPLALLFPQLRMHFPYIFLVLCFSIFLWSLLSNPLFLTTLSEIAPHLILSLHSAFFLLPSTPLHDIILYICLCSTSMQFPQKNNFAFLFSLTKMTPFRGAQSYLSTPYFLATDVAHESYRRNRSLLFISSDNFYSKSNSSILKTIIASQEHVVKRLIKHCQILYNFLALSDPILAPF